MSANLDYSTYKEVSGDLLSPIASEGLDVDTLKRLYLSKLVYLNNIREKCFRDVNTDKTPFKVEDLEHICKAIKSTNQHLRELVVSKLTIAIENYPG